MAQQVINNALQEWNQEIQKAKAALHPDEDGACYIMSLTRRKQGIVGGVISKVSVDVAGLHIAGETHREATPEESAAWNAEQEVRRDKQLKEAAKRESKVNFDLGPIAEMLVRLGLNAGAAQAPQPAATPAPAVVAAAPIPAPVAAAAPVQAPVRPARSSRTEATADDASRF